MTDESARAPGAKAVPIAQRNDLIVHVGDERSDAMVPAFVPDNEALLPQFQRRQQQALQAANLPVYPVLFVRQVHGDQVVQASPATPVGLPADALATTAKSLYLGVYSADCLPILLAGPSAIAAAHAGWRGLCAGAIERALDAVCQLDACEPSAVSAVIGPAICQRCFEVRGDALVQLTAAAGKYNAPQAISAQPQPDPRDECATVHLAGLAVAALRARGLAPGTIEVHSACTRCSPGLHSFRRDGRAAGRQACLIARRGSERS